MLTSTTIEGSNVVALLLDGATSAAEVIEVRRRDEALVRLSR